MARYSDVLFEHARSPRNGGKLDSPDAIGTSDIDGRAPRTTVYLRLQNGVIEAASFEVFGCGVLIAACSVLTELAIGQSVSDCVRLTQAHVVDALNGVPPDKLFCADLAVAAMRDALSKIISQEARLD
ncbi:MAG: iron-sulfur cluster assembly scaffold protein [Planctomycetaceae bacterium]|nr:iron-sulfur cluster assembly scaffold protein [Planctomycetales bacterium]MCB9875185.1 iron-sulfur cluster assembly scaffold protein [Planctomycetaceae bacterium]MCB9941920.1 iron-sulfur cluster assembly scaffold protein [Planctomycetaceae bacterium]